MATAPTRAGPDRVQPETDCQPFPNRDILHSRHISVISEFVRSIARQRRNTLVPLCHTQWPAQAVRNVVHSRTELTPAVTFTFRIATRLKGQGVIYEPGSLEPEWRFQFRAWRFRSVEDAFLQYSMKSPYKTLFLNASSNFQSGW